MVREISVINEKGNEVVSIDSSDKGKFFLAKNQISMKDVVEEAGVSITTVSRVINEVDYPVSEETKQAVKKAVEKFNYQPNQVARNLVTKSSSIIEIIVHDISTEYFSEMLRGIEEKLFNNNKKIYTSVI